MKTRLIATLLTLAATGPAAAADWTFSVMPYLWATDVGIDVTVRDRTLVDATIPFEDLLEDLDSAVILRADAMHGPHGIAIDVFDVTVADEVSQALPGGTGAQLVLDAEIGMTLLDVTGVYDPAGDGRGLALLYGMRLIGQRETISASTEGDGAVTRDYDEDDTYVDALVGLRYAGALPGRWSYQLEGDVSTGGTELTWSIYPSIGYTFGAEGQYRLSGGYRYVEVDFDTEPGIDLDMTLDGLLVGFQFSF